MLKITTKDLGSNTTTEELIDFTASPSSLSVGITPQNIPSYYDGWAYSSDDVHYKTSYNSNSATEQFITAGLKSIYVRGFRVIDGEEILADIFKKEDVTITASTAICVANGNENAIGGYPGINGTYEFAGYNNGAPYWMLFESRSLKSVTKCHYDVDSYYTITKSNQGNSNGKWVIGRYLTAGCWIGTPAFHYNTTQYNAPGNTENPLHSTWSEINLSQC